MDILTLHTHMVSRKLHHHPPSIHLTSTVYWLKKERKKNWLRASFTGQSLHWSVSFWENKLKKETTKTKLNHKILTPEKNGCFIFASVKFHQKRDLFVFNY